MALKKAELQSQHDEYHAILREAIAAEGQGMYSTAVDLAMSAWEFIDGMMQFERRFNETETRNVLAIDIVLKYAPLLFNSEALAELESVLKANRRIDKNASDDLARMLADARSRLWKNHRLYGHLEANPNCRQDSLRKLLDGDQDYWRTVAEAWAAMGLLQRVPEGASYRLTLVTRLGQVVSAKCPNCGELIEAPKAMLLDTLECPTCAGTHHFVLISTKPA